MPCPYKNNNQRFMLPLLGTILIALAKVIDMVINLYTLLIAGAVIVSWLNPDPYNPIVKFLHSATEPLFSKVRRYLPAFLRNTGIDWTPALVLILLVFFQTVLTTTLIDWGRHLRP